MNGKNWLLSRHPIRCGLLKYELELQLRRTAIVMETAAADILYLGRLYITGSKMLVPSAPRWPDMEYVFHGQDRLFIGEMPKTLVDALKKFDFGRGYSVQNLARNRRNQDPIMDAKQILCIED
ncbi:hypothetical protein Ptr902_01543 [Pyrenophora tritici-repentis]|uniref:Uncharacterized protein n=2 Tax=Pyrenophora tritici-repentis TaxID=45151 RepID=A0A2W1GP97_9PLEO|nr:hypothetical protein Alg215_06428 [Pyrenophora tritici-repentis]KAI0583066.1 hypothetical protein Alg130_05838 [Pyrenophora tritici-repentis]KAI0610262.1 hypothetical protein TUN205_05506 [Pyrenophora tritici-repentis]KAI0622204.1 hypothetical protein TUN199_05819 [Pyrenophora tritici-repentis]KAI1520937.1 hypothetical protein Ptr86124_001305 [Pyrenophora tritici-repentis]